MSTLFDPDIICWHGMSKSDAATHHHTRLIGAGFIHPEGHAEQASARLSRRRAWFEGCHVGTRDQARMRAGRSGILLRVIWSLPALRDAKILRRPDCAYHKGAGWRETSRRAAKSGAQAIVYLNRTEGIPLEAFERFRARRNAEPDRFADSMIRRHLPEASDSVLVLDASLIAEVVPTPMDEPDPNP